MISSTQNNHKHDNAQATHPKSTIKNVDSYEEKTNNTSYSEHAAASKTASEAETIKNSLNSSISANNFDAKLKHSPRSGEVHSKKNTHKDDIQSQSTGKSDGKLHFYGNSNLNAKTKDKSPMTSYTTVSAVRSLNSPIHQKPLFNSNKMDKDDANYPIPLDTPLPPAISIASKSNQNEIELNDNDEREPLFCNENKCSKSADINVSCQKEVVADTTSIWEKSRNPSNLQIISLKGESDSPTTQQCDFHSTGLEDVGVSPSRTVDIIEHDCDNLERRSNSLASKYKNADNLEKSEDISTRAVSGFSDLENQENIHKTVPVVKKDGEAKQTKGDNPESPHHF